MEFLVITINTTTTTLEKINSGWGCWDARYSETERGLSWGWGCQEVDGDSEHQRKGRKYPVGDEDKEGKRRYWYSS